MPNRAPEASNGSARRNGSGRATRDRARSTGGLWTRRGQTFRLFLIIGFILSAAAALTLRLRLGVPAVWAWLAGINLATFLAYAYDKSAALRTLRRVPERVLHLLALAGGTPAALVAQGAFHHKTIKGSFRRWFWTIFIVQLIVLGAWLYYARPWT